jgi:ribosomal protein S20
MALAVPYIDRAAQKGVIGKKTAARTKSRLAHALAGVGASA